MHYTLYKACSQGLLKGYQTLLLQYANDITFFIEGLVEEAKNLSTSLDLLLDFSSLQINCTKSVFIQFGLAHEEEFFFKDMRGEHLERCPLMSMNG